MVYIPHPVHHIHIQSKLVTDIFPVAVCCALPIKGITLLMGNDLAGDKVTPELKVLDVPPCNQNTQAVFCAISFWWCHSYASLQNSHRYEPCLSL